ncbi:MAG: hypothetical protein JOZ51_01055 [Chloroflexi bacterium]|nr:hypothetical protein [Chloroflexota bacterium]
MPSGDQFSGTILSSVAVSAIVLCILKSAAVMGSGLRLIGSGIPAATGVPSADAAGEWLDDSVGRAAVSARVDGVLVAGNVSVLSGVVSTVVVSVSAVRDGDIVAGDALLSLIEGAPGMPQAVSRSVNKQHSRRMRNRRSMDGTPR